jgi:hypothetical protein
MKELKVFGSKLKRDNFLEKYPEQITKKGDRFIAYQVGNNEGFVFLKYEDRVDLYSYDDGPYIKQGSFKTLEDAVKEANTYT